MCVYIAIVYASNEQLEIDIKNTLHHTTKHVKYLNLTKAVYDLNTENDQKKCWENNPKQTKNNADKNKLSKMKSYNYSENRRLNIVISCTDSM